MGITCCKCETKIDVIGEIKKGSIREGSFSIQNSKFLTVTTNSEQIIIKQKENSFKDYSLLLFQEFNKFRLQPQQYYIQSIQYNFTNILKELIKNKNNENNKKDLELKWSTKNEIIIYNIMQDKTTNDIVIKLKNIKKRFENLFDLIILYVIGNYNNIKESIWKLLKNFKKLGEKKFNKIITDKIDYCVIYSMQCDNVILRKLYNREKKIDISDKNNKDLENKDFIKYYGIENSLRDKIISFYFLFICLDEIKNNLENSDIIYW